MTRYLIPAPYWCSLFQTRAFARKYYILYPIEIIFTRGIQLEPSK